MKIFWRQAGIKDALNCDVLPGYSQWMPANIIVKDSQRPENIELTAQIPQVEMPPGRESLK
jgi:hypothetical protein